MTSFWTCLLFAAVVISAGRPFQFVSLNCNSTNLARFGQPSMLECVVHLSKEATNAKIVYVKWKRGDTSLILYTYSKLKQEPGFRFAKADWNERDMNVSLLVDNTKVADEGTFTCIVSTDRGGAQYSANLSVTAKYSTPDISSLTVKDIEPPELFCHSSGYPEAEVRWFGKDYEDLTHSSTPAVEKRDNGLFNISSKLTPPPGSRSSRYTCCVYHQGDKQVEAVFEVPGSASKATGGSKLHSGTVSKVVAPLVVIGALIVGLLVLLVFKKRSHHHQQVPELAEEDFASPETAAPE